MRFKSRFMTLIVTTALSTAALASNIHADSVRDDSLMLGQQYTQQSGDPATLTAVAVLVVDAASNAIQNELESVISEALFGSDGPDVVTLSAESIAQIKAVVDASNFEVEANRFQTDLEAYDSQEELYHQIVSNDGEDLNLLNSLSNRTADLINHHLFDSNYNADYYMMTGNFASVASSRMAVLSEYVTQGYSFNSNYLETEADNMAIELTTMGNAADQFINGEVYVINPPPSCEGAVIYSLPEEPRTLLNAPDTTQNGKSESAQQQRGIQTQGSSCVFRVIDEIKDRTQYFSVHIYGYSLAGNRAYALMNNWRDEHRDMFKGDNYNEVVSALQNFPQ